MRKPIFAEKFYLPTRNDIDLFLVLGAAIFGIVWGISGYCPGPAVTSLVQQNVNPFIFIIAFFIGSFSFKY